MVGWDSARDLLRRGDRLGRLASLEDDRWRRRELSELTANRLQAGGVVRVPMVANARDVGLHHRAAELLGADLLADRGLHQVRAGEEDRAGALDDVRLVAHDRQVGATGHARTHDRGALVDPRRRQAGVVVEGPAEVLSIGEDLVLERQEDPGRVDQVDDRQPVLERDLLRPQDLLAGQREPGPRLDGGIVRHHDHLTVVDPAESHDNAGRRRATVLLVETVSHPQAELEKRAAFVAQGGDSLAGGHLAACPVALHPFTATAEAQLLLLGPDLLQALRPVGMRQGVALVLLHSGFDSVHLAIIGLVQWPHRPC